MSGKGRRAYLGEDNLTDAAYANARCPLCGGKGAEYFERSTAKYGDYHVDECKACDFIYVREIPSKSFLRDAYRLRYGESDVFQLDGRIHKKI